MQTLRDWVPHEFLDSYDDVPAYKHLDVEVVKDYSLFDYDEWKSWPGIHKNVMNWCVLANGYAVGWNESASRGWTFPMVRIK